VAAGGACAAGALVAGGKINWGPFAWNDETDGADLLDEEGEDAVSYYYLGYDTEVVGTGAYHFPFGKGGEIYIAALVDAQKAGGVVGDYATKLLSDIVAQKKQSYQPKRARPIEEGLRWRHDGFLKGFV
jgi:hypothetical protein